MTSELFEGAASSVGTGEGANVEVAATLVAITDRARVVVRMAVLISSKRTLVI
jgi:hypothetical protein